MTRTDNAWLLIAAGAPIAALLLGLALWVTHG